VVSFSSSPSAHRASCPLANLFRRSFFSSFCKNGANGDTSASSPFFPSSKPLSKMRPFLPGNSRVSAFPSFSRPAATFPFFFLSFPPPPSPALKTQHGLPGLPFFSRSVTLGLSSLSFRACDGKSSLSMFLNRFFLRSEKPPPSPFPSPIFFHRTGARDRLPPFFLSSSPPRTKACSYPFFFSNT